MKWQKVNFQKAGNTYLYLEAQNKQNTMGYHQCGFIKARSLHSILQILLLTHWEWLRNISLKKLSEYYSEEHKKNWQS